ncbi:unnamed protein product [Adineta ricciae]|uniref:Uncharacterized protein n=1 Tax=Adineta ricciae TaxID=249248 RepID=A0A814HDN6_ADIRI|nr:unnamed protein product [Adineta ricciae]
MATRNKCSVCTKNAGTSICPGCQAYFCDNDFKDHRGKLTNELDGLVIERNLLQEKINKTNINKAQNNTFLPQIDEWQRTTIEKVKQVADQARKQVLELINSDLRRITKGLEELTQELKQLTDTKDVLEQDLVKLKEDVNRLNNAVAQLAQPSTITLNVTNSDKIQWNQMIFVEQNKIQTDKQPTPQLQQQNASSQMQTLQCGGHPCSSCHLGSLFT